MSISGLLCARSLAAQPSGLPETVRAWCGHDAKAAEGAIAGTVRLASGQAAAGLQVAVIWSELVVGTDSTRTLLRAVVDTSDTQGTFVLCSLPRETRLLLRAGDDTLRTGELSVEIAAVGTLTLELLAGTQLPHTSIRGRLLAEAGGAVSGEVLVSGEESLVARTDTAGYFRLTGVPRRSQQLSVRAIGFAPQSLDIAPDGSEVDLGDIRLLDPVTVLPDVSITERILKEHEAGFLYRRQVLRGFFFDEEELARYPRVHAGVLAGRAPSLRGSPGGLVQFDRGFRRCTPRYWIDGHPFNRSINPEFLDESLRRAKRIEIYNAQQAPAEFTDFDGCGAVVVWTQ